MLIRESVFLGLELGRVALRNNFLSYPRVHAHMCKLQMAATRMVGKEMILDIQG